MGREQSPSENGMESLKSDFYQESELSSALAEPEVMVFSKMKKSKKKKMKSSSASAKNIL